MQYKGKLYGNVGGKYIELDMVSDNVDSLEAELEQTKDELAEARKDAARVDSIETNVWHLVPVDTGEDSYGWEIRQSVIGKPDVVVAMSNSEDPRKAIDAATDGGTE